MNTRHILGLGLLTCALAATPVTLGGVNAALADDSETMNGAPNNNQQYGNWPNQGGWNQGNRNNCGYGQNCARNNAEQERRESRFSRKNRDGREGGGRDSDGGDD